MWIRSQKYPSGFLSKFLLLWKSMEIIQSIILGVVQGVTEFIPISSDGHLVLVRKIFGFRDQGLAFDAVLHLGTLLAVILYFKRDIFEILKNGSKSKKLFWQIVLATIPAAIAGFLFEDLVASFFRDTLWVATFFILTSFIFLLAEKYYGLKFEKKELTRLDWKDSLIIGIAQIFALLPGVSRSGMTITAGMFRFLKRVEAARFSFLMSIPIVFGAGAKSAIDLFSSFEFQNEKLGILFGFIAALLAGYFSIKFLMNFLKNHRLYIFSAYLFFVGLILFILQWA
jgi:undecaprenyl-diphosphatase